MIDNERQQHYEHQVSLSDEQLSEVWRQSSQIHPDGRVTFVEPMYNEVLKPDKIPEIIWNEPRWREGLQNIMQLGPSLRMKVCLSRHDTASDFQPEFKEAIERAGVVFAESFGWSDQHRDAGLTTVKGEMPEHLARATDGFESAQMHALAQYRKVALMADIDDGTKTAVSRYIKDASDRAKMLEIGEANPDDFDLHRKMLLATYSFSGMLREWVMIAEAGKQLQELGISQAGESLAAVHVVGSQHVGLLHKYRTLGVSHIDYALDRRGETLDQMRQSDKALFDMAETGTVHVNDLP